jgi:hypothetical protein
MSYGVHAPGGGIVGAAGAAGQIGSTFTKLIPIITKVSLIITALTACLVILGDSGTAAERATQGFAKVMGGFNWWMGKFGNIMAIVGYTMDLIMLPILGVIDGFKVLTIVMQDLWKGRPLKALEDFKEGMKNIYTKGREDEDKIKADRWENVQQLFGKAKPGKPDPFTFKPASIQTVGFTELGKAQQQIALQAQMANDEKAAREAAAKAAADALVVQKQIEVNTRSLKNKEASPIMQNAVKDWRSTPFKPSIMPMQPVNYVAPNNTVVNVHSP